MYLQLLILKLELSYHCTFLVQVTKVNDSTRLHENSTFIGFIFLLSPSGVQNYIFILYIFRSAHTIWLWCFSKAFPNALCNDYQEILTNLTFSFAASLCPMITPIRKCMHLAFIPSLQAKFCHFLLHGTVYQWV